MAETVVPGGTEAPEPAPEASQTPSAAPDAATPTRSEGSASPPATDSGEGNGAGPGADAGGAATTGTPGKRRRRGSRGGRKRSKPRTAEGANSGGAGSGAATQPQVEEMAHAQRQPFPPADRASRGRGNGPRPAPAISSTSPATGPAPEDRTPELPDLHREGRPASVEAAAKALVPKAPRPGAPPKPKIGDPTPAGALRPVEPAKPGDDATGDGGKRRRRRRGSRGGRSSGAAPTSATSTTSTSTTTTDRPIEAVAAHEPAELDEETLERRRGRERKGRPVGRYMMTVHVTPGATQIAVLEGRSLIEHYVSHPSDDVSQIHGNIYLGRVQNVLPGMEAAFVDIGTPKNAVLYRGDVHYDPEDIEGGTAAGRPRIEDVLKAGQTILCQVTKNPIGAKGARLTQEVSLPGRFVVLIPNSSTYGISKRLPDDERRLLSQWEQIEALAKRSRPATLLYREPDMVVRVIREEFNQEYRSVLIDDADLHAQVRDYVTSITPALADRVQYYDAEAERLPLFERHHVHEQLHRALDRKVWLPSGGSLIIERTEALTVIDVNTGKNVGRSSLEETVFKNNLEAAVEVARQLRLRDIGGIIVVDFIDMERKDNREEVVRVFRDALSRDKTRTQVFEISELGLCEMTRKRIGEGLLESFVDRCPECEGRGVLIDKGLLRDCPFLPARTAV